MKKKIDREFDVKVRIEVKVMPQAVPEFRDKIIWDGIEHQVDFEGRKMGYSLEKYFEGMAQELINIKFDEAEGFCSCHAWMEAQGICVHCYRPKREY